MSTRNRSTVQSDGAHRMPPPRKRSLPKTEQREIAAAHAILCGLVVSCSPRVYTRGLLLCIAAPRDVFVDEVFRGGVLSAGAVMSMRISWVGCASAGLRIAGSAYTTKSTTSVTRMTIATVATALLLSLPFVRGICSCAIRSCYE